MRDCLGFLRNFPRALPKGNPKENQDNPEGRSHFKKKEKIGTKSQKKGGGGGSDPNPYFC